MSIIKSNMTAPPPSGGALSSIGDMNSLRFDGTSYLSRTFGSGSQTTATFSFWGKVLSDGAIFSTGGYPTDLFELGFYSTQFFAQNTPNSSTRNLHLVTTSNYRDTSAWYHFIIAIDTNATNGKCDIYVNGSLINDFETNTLSTTALNLGSNTNYYIGRRATGDYKFNGYLANIHFIDGQALDANAFGEEISGVWVPKAYDPATSGAYGTNGFHLDFAASNMDWTNSKVLDASGNGNNWDIN